MKRLLPLIAMLFILVGCKENYEKAVDKYIQENFNDPASYECVELSKPQEYTTILYAMDVLKEKAKAEGWSADSIFNKTMELRPYLEANGEDPEKVLLRFVEHTYRVNNGFGAKELHKEKWYLNDDLTKVMSIDPL